jgi:hypothetical protein
MKAKELRDYLNMAIQINPNADCYINGNPIGVNADDVGDIDLYEVCE